MTPPLKQDSPALRQHLSHEEGERLFPYPDSVGKITIGRGHNLTDKGITPAVEEMLYAGDVADAFRDLDKHLPWWNMLDEVRQIVMADLCFNMGIGKLLGFKLFLAAMQAGQWDVAAHELATSKWDRQVGPRADVLEEMVRSGVDKSNSN